MSDVCTLQLIDWMLRPVSWRQSVWARVLLLTAAAVAVACFPPLKPLGRGGGGDDSGENKWDGRCEHDVAFIESHPKCAELKARAAEGEVFSKYHIAPAPPPPIILGAGGTERCEHNPIFIATHPKCAWLEMVHLGTTSSRAALG